VEKQEIPLVFVVSSLPSPPAHQVDRFFIHSWGSRPTLRCNTQTLT
jgi:hypothetical protein